jgi:5-methyltetrahydropteroyltriglutamate--homocysteine methyltransferase
MVARYRTDQVGSLVRPPQLLEARAAREQGRASIEQVQAAVDEAILAALDMQRQVGIDVYTDGEYRRALYYGVVTDAVEGFVQTETPGDARRWRGPSGDVEVVQRRTVVNARLRSTDRLTAEQAAFLKRHAPGPFKITLPSASHFMVSNYQPGLSDQAYPSRWELLQDLAAIIGGEMKALSDEGVPYLQMDAPDYTYYVDPHTRAQMADAGVDPDQAFEEATRANNACFDAVAGRDITLAVHLCRGNYRGRWLREGSYDPIAEKLFNSLRADRFLLEYDTERSGGFEPLRFVPRGKQVVLGLVSSKTPQLEDPSALRRRIDEASRYVPIEDLAISPQCGFASNVLGNTLSWDDQRRKLELVVQTAQQVWG